MPAAKTKIHSPKNYRSRIVISAILIVIGLFLVIWLQQSRTSAHSQSNDSQDTNSQDTAGQAAFAPRNSSTPSKAEVRSNYVETTIQYGNGDGQIGIIRGAGGQPVSGPESFTIGADGSVYLADQVNQRVLVYSNGGELLRSISISGIGLADLTVDGKGNIYVYDDAERRLSQFSSDGSLLKNLLLNPADIVSRGYVHIEGQSVYFANSANTDILIASVQDGILTAADLNSDRNSDGIHSVTGKVYSIDVTRGQDLQVRVHNDSENLDEQQFTVSLPGILSATYVGEDQNGQFYIQTERSDGTAIALEVQKFDMKGQLLATTRMPETDYALGTTKLLEVGNDGAIVQFLPQNDQATLQIFQ
jgi:hypothetical protein